MAGNLIRIDRHTPMLLPPDLRDWVDDDDAVHYILSVVDRVPDCAASVNVRGTGSAQYPPRAMLALLLYCYSQGIYSSRKIERATHTHIGVRFLMANHHPDHDTIARFRRRNKAYIKQAFVTTVRVAQELGYSSLGKMAIDGTSLRASAGRKTSMQYGRLEELAAELCEERVDLAEQADKRDSDSPGNPSSPSDRTVREAFEKIDQSHQKQKEERETMRECVKAGGVGSLPHSLPDEVPKEKKINIVDPECRIMPMKEGYCAAGYNAQLAVDTESTLITAALISGGVNDNHQLLPVAEAAYQNSQGSLKTVVADSGYDNNHQIIELEKRIGVHPVVGVQDPHRLSTKHRQNRRRQRAREVKIRRIEELSTTEGKELMRKRKSTVETVFGTLKHAMQFRAFLTRGRENVSNEWNLISTAYNLKRLMNLRA